MNAKDILIILVRLFGLYQFYVFAIGIVRGIAILVTGSHPEYMNLYETATQAFAQPLFSLILASSIFKWESKLTSFILQPIQNIQLTLSRKTILVIIISIMGISIISTGFPSLISDLYLYLDYQRIAEQGLTVISEGTRAFNMESTKNPIFAVIYDTANLALGCAILYKAKFLTAFIENGINSNSISTEIQNPMNDNID